ncbi:hypothetical protein [Clostridium perfringens]|uniref:hypothetical protein n=1 Tax=Clostridium perfringens TaxID=1502 RepID=UPI001FB098A2|nr:hypothetical protein [Clostridium perfringens]
MRGKNELDKSKVKSLYLDGFSANEIAIRMDSNREAVKKCIQRNFSDLREHNKAKRELKKLQNEEIRRRRNWMCSSFRCSQTF